MQLAGGVPCVVHPGCHHTATLPFPLVLLKIFYFTWFIFIFLMSARARNKGCAPCCHRACPRSSAAHSGCFLAPSVQGWARLQPPLWVSQAEQALEGFSSHCSPAISSWSVVPGASCLLGQALPQDVVWVGSWGELGGLWAPDPEQGALEGKLGPRDGHIFPSACVRLDHKLGRWGKARAYPRAVRAIISP